MKEDTLSADRFYTEICSNIRATDDISFKVMGFVPLISGATLLTFFLKGSVPQDKALLILALALFAALITLGFFRWELRNIQTCSWLKRRAEAIERELVRETGAPKQPDPPLKIGKTEAEKWIYATTILAWLVMPLTVLDLCEELAHLIVVYGSMSALIVILTALCVIASVRVAKSDANGADYAKEAKK